MSPLDFYLKYREMTELELLLRHTPSLFDSTSRDASLRNTEILRRDVGNAVIESARTPEAMREFSALAEKAKIDGLDAARTTIQRRIDFLPANQTATLREELSALPKGPDSPHRHAQWQTRVANSLQGLSRLRA